MREDTEKKKGPHHRSRGHLFKLAETQKQKRCPSVSEWVNKLWSIQTMEYSSVVKRIELSNHEKTWRKHKCMLLSKRSQPENITYLMIPTV